MSVAILALIALTLQTDAARAPRPGYEQLIAAVHAERPAARILSQDFRESRRGGARIGCGLIEIDGHIEPFSVTAIWDTPSGTVVHVVGVPPRPVQPAHWEINVQTPSRGDNDKDGDIDRMDRNYDVMRRRFAMIFCDTLRAPEGVVWAVDVEPNPDPAREARARALADQATALIFGPEVAPRE